ncbi:MAG: flavin reductase family protein [Nanoarchaeota archaeon]
MIDLAWGDLRKNKFVTNVGLITSKGPKGDNIMAAEWTYHVSYSPGRIAVLIGKNKITRENILKTKEFGVNIAAEDQNIVASIAGNYHGQDFDKISILKELNFKFIEAKNIDVLMLDHGALQAECKLIENIELGSHILFLGEILELYPLSSDNPLIYTDKKYWKKSEQIEKPDEEYMRNIQRLAEKHKR